MGKHPRFANLLVIFALLAGGLALAPQHASADSIAQPLPFAQDWSDPGMITLDNNWSGVPGIMGYRGDGLTTVDGVDPQTVLVDDTPGRVNVLANQTFPDFIIYPLGVAEFHHTNAFVGSTIGMIGSSTADAPYLLISINTTGWENIQVSYDVRDIEQTLDDAPQQVALHYRVGTGGNFTNLPGGYVADATAPVEQPIRVTHVAVTLPAAANNQPLVQLRIMTTYAIGTNEWVGIDDIQIAGLPPADPAPTVVSSTPADGATGVAQSAGIGVTFSEPVNAPPAAFTILCVTSGTHPFTLENSGDTTFTLQPLSVFAAEEQCTVTVSALQVTDLDANDPDDNMAGDYVFSFHTAPDPLPTVLSTIPADDATNVPRGDPLIITFSEAVNAAAGFFSISCLNSGTTTGTVTTTDSTIYTIDPTGDFGFSDTCSVTLENTLITEQGGSGRPMLADHTWFFSTAAATCNDPFTPVYTIQGSGAFTTFNGTVTTQGVVVGDYEGPAPNLRGYYLQDLAGDGNPATSDGIFIYNGSNNTVNLGEVVRVTGIASEYEGQTQISQVTNTLLCGTGASVAPTPVLLPLPSQDYPERYEGMLVALPQTLYVTDSYLLGRFGQVTLSSGARLQQPTNVATPGAAALALQAQNNLNRILLDDAANLQNPDPILFARGGLALSAGNTLRGGDSLSGVVGVMTYTWGGVSASPNAYRVRPLDALGGGAPDFQPANPRPTAVPAVGGRLQVAGLNTLNYFNTFGAGACASGLGGAVTDCRGADNLTEFNRQWPKIVQAILASDAEVIALVELENDGYGSASAIQHLVNQLNAATTAGAYAFIDVDALTGQVNALGTDAIKVALLYQPAVVTPVGVTAVLNTTAFVNGGDAAARNRPALAQAFAENAGGARFVVVVNHLKSKGSACDEPDAGDGQGNCNAVRSSAAAALAAWLAGDPTGTADPDVLLLGDLNAYAMEDPITLLAGAGYASLLPGGSYGYTFDGQWGALDHALGSTSLAGQVSGAAVFHLNADEPGVLDYNTEYKSLAQLTSLYSADAFRAADHDPLVVGLALNRDPQAQDQAPTTPEDTPLTGTLVANDPDGDALTFAAGGTAPQHGALVISAAGAFSYTPDADYFGPDSFTFSVSDSRGGTDSGTVSISVTPLNDAPTPPEIGNVTWTAGQPGSYTIPPFTDVDGDPLVYTARLYSGGELPDWLRFDTATLTFSGTPTALDVGDFLLLVEVDDGQGGGAGSAFTLTVESIQTRIFLPFVIR